MFAMPKIRNRLACTAASLMIAGVGALALQPAQAATDPGLTICNSTASVGHIWTWDTRYGHDGYSSGYLAKGACVTRPNAGNEARVDVDPEYPGDGDVDSYYIGVIGSGYGPCHDSENSASDPPNAGTTPNGVRYNTNAGHC